MKLLFINNIPSPYRVDFFNQLGKVVDLTVIFEAETNNKLNPSWFKAIGSDFKPIFLKEGTIEEKKLNFKIFKYLKKGKQDYIVVTNYAYLTEMMALLYIKLRRIPYILEIDGGVIREENYIKYLWKRFLISGANAYVSPSKETDKFLENYGVNSKKIYRYNFTSLNSNDILKVPISTEEKIRFRNQLKIKEKKIILSVGQFIHRKGFDILIKSVTNLSSDYGVYIIGGTPTQEYIELLKKYELTNIHFINFLSKEELAYYYYAADIFVFPTREDIWGLVVNEAMAKALPVITTNKCVSGLELIVDYENGFIVESEDVVSLAEKIIILMEDSHLLENIQFNNLEKIKKYTIEDMVSRHLEIIYECSSK